MDYLKATPSMWALIILSSATIFTILWFMDALTHKKLVGHEITEKELNTHRILIGTSVLMELSLVLMYWSSILALPLFVASFLTRTAHEFIDELYFHMDRCSNRETALHLGMWLSVLVKTSAMFIWGFFSNYVGIESLSFWFFLWGLLVFLVMSYTSYVEWNHNTKQN